VGAGSHDLQAKSWEPAYSQALVQNKIDRQAIIDLIVFKGASGSD